MDKTVVLKEIKVEDYPNLLEFEYQVTKLRRQGFFIYVKLTTDHMNRAGYESYRYWKCSDEILYNLDFGSITQWYINIIDYLVFVDGDEVRILKNRFGKDQKMVIVA